MDNDNISIRQGARLDLQITQADADSVSATLLLQDADDNIYEFEVEYVDGIADFTDREDISTLDVGTYSYQINENFASGQPDIYPDTSSCDDGCELPTFEICESIGSEES